MNIITYQDNDQLNRPQASEGGIYTQDAWATSPVSAYQLFKRFPRVFPDGVGALAGEYHMCWISRLGQFNMLLAEFHSPCANVVERYWKI